MANAKDIEKGLRGVAQRIVNAEVSFIETLMRMGGITKPDAEKVLRVYRKLKVVKTDAVNGEIKVKHGGLLDRAVIRTALESKEML
jgi:hypothetical protein